MGHAYRAVGWNRQKKIYDRTLGLGLIAYLVLFVVVGLLRWPEHSEETLALRALGTGALLLLHVILSIGPLARLDHRWLPLLYNRRHLGVLMFCLALVHGVFATVYYHSLTDGNPVVDPLISVLSANQRSDSLAHFPFEIFGVVALAILFLMAATSHDFWLANLTAPVWKALHMLVYVAYASVVLHVALGTLQGETSPVLSGLVGVGVVWVLGLHLVVGWRERGLDRPTTGSPSAEGYLDVAAVDELKDGQAKIVTLSGDRVAVFRNGDEVSVVSNACQHQNGPLGEGRIIDGLIVCPWHGYQYQPRCGRSPEPFTEKIPTFRAQVRAGRVWVHPTPLAAGTDVEPARIGAEA